MSKVSDRISGFDALDRRQVMALGGAAALAAAFPGLARAADPSITLWHGWTGADNTTANNNHVQDFFRMVFKMGPIGLARAKRKLSEGSVIGAGRHRSL